jgi:pimeloyl-ACP methyl ester carboxylesterase
MLGRGGARIALLACAAVIALAMPAGAGAQIGVPTAPGTSPPGANDWGCVPPPEHPVPVILVHGTFGDMTVSWNALAPLLQRDGFCVFALDYGARGTWPMEQSADQVAQFAWKVMTATRADNVSFVGHSQGGSLSRLVVRYRELLDHTDDVVGLAPSSHGTTNPFAGPAGSLGCAACLDQIAGSAEMAHLNAPPEAPGGGWGPFWTVVSTEHDEVVTPVASQALSGDTVTNVLVQDRCPHDPTEHLGIIYDPVALQWARNALLRAGPANPAFQPDCTGLTLGTDPGGGAGGGGTAGAAQPSRLKPHLTVLSRTLRIHRGWVTARVRCDGPSGTACRKRLALRSRGRTLASNVARLRAGHAGKVGLRLRRGSSRILRTRRGRLATLAGVPVSIRRR